MEYPGGGAPFDERVPYPHLCVWFGFVARSRQVYIELVEATVCLRPVGDALLAPRSLRQTLSARLTPERGQSATRIATETRSIRNRIEGPVSAPLGPKTGHHAPPV